MYIKNFCMKFSKRDFPSHFLGLGRFWSSNRTSSETFQNQGNERKIHVLKILYKKSDMIAWIYSDPEIVDFRTVVTPGGQKILKGGKTIVELSNRFRVDGNVMCDDFMQFESPPSAEQVPARLWTPRGASPSIQVRRRYHSVTRQFWEP